MIGSGSSPQLPSAPTSLRGSRVAWLLGLFVGELLMLAVTYQFFAQIECYRLGEQAVCEALKSLVARAFVVLAVGAIVMMARPLARRRFLAGTQTVGWWGWPAIHLVGLGLLFWPLVQVGSGDLGAQFSAALGPWAAGGAAAALGGLFWMVRPRVWAGLASDLGPVALTALVAAAVLPDLAEAIRPIWDWSFLTRLTFNAVAVFLAVFGTPVVVDPAGLVIGARDFAVHVSRQCSGVEGFVLVSAFVAIYALIFRETLRMRRFLAVVLPLALALSWLLNVVRIGVLILIGAHVSPTIAVNGFHSYAGWLFFTLLALGLIVAVHVTPWLHKGQVARHRPPFWSDPLAAAIVPFAAFMLVATLVQALAPHPEIGYPVKSLVLLLVVMAFLPAYLRLSWRLDPVALLAGLLIGVGWVALAQPDDGELGALLGSMTPESYASWVALRLLGTVLLVPLIEEMFFRGYMLMRMDCDAPRGWGWRRIAAITLSSAAFGILHGRVIEAGIAGVIFALLALRTDRVTSAIQAHVAANACIAVVALMTQNYAII